MVYEDLKKKKKKDSFMALRGTFAFHSVKRSSEAVRVVKEVVFRRKHEKAICCLRFFDRIDSALKDLRTRISKEDSETPG